MLTLINSCTPEYFKHGDELDPDRLLAIRAGVQTKDDVLVLLGSPSTTSMFRNDVWFYVGDTEEKLSIFDVNIKQRQIVAIYYDQSQTVTQVSLLGIDASKEVDFVNRETPSLGESMGLFDQLIGNLGRFNRDDKSK